MIAELALSLAVVIWPTAPSAQLQQSPAPSPAAAHNSKNEPTIEASLWFVSFESRVPADKLPIDPRTAAASVGQNYGKGADGRIPTWGLARQVQMKDLEIVDGALRLVCRDGKLLSENRFMRGGAREDATDLQNITGEVVSPPWQIVSAPRIVVALHQQGTVSVGRPIQYLAKDANDCLKVEEAPGMMEGVELKLTASKILPEGIRFTGISLKFCRVTGRQPIDGVPFDVGRPIIDTRETSLDITLDNGKLAIIPLPQGENEPALLVFMTARVVDR